MSEISEQAQNAVEVRAIPNTKKAVKEFVHMARGIYVDYPNYVPPIYSEQVKMIFKGPFNKIGEKQLFIAYRDGKAVARISAHISFAHNEHYKVNQGFFGFFETYDDQQAVDAVVDAGVEWLKEKGCTSMRGPMNFAIYDEIGLLIDCFDRDPVVLCTYNPPYYQKLLENSGFKKEVDWYAYLKAAADPIPYTMGRVTERIAKKPGVVIREAKKKNWKQEVETVRHIFELAWSENWGNVPFSDEQWHTMTEEMKMILIERMALVLEVDGEPVAFSITIPDANFAIKKANGRLLPFGIFKILFNIKKTPLMRTVIMGVLKEYRNRGYDLALVHKTIENAREDGITMGDCSLIVETNQLMKDGLEAIGCVQYKTYRILKKEF